MVIAHFQTIKDDPMKFIQWILVSIVLSLSTIWLPSFLGVAYSKDVYSQLITNNPLISFSVIFLCNVLFSSLVKKGSGSKDLTAGLRSIAIIIIVIFLVILSSILPLKLLAGLDLNIGLQYLLFILSLCIGLYGYGFRENNWEKTVDDVREQEELEVASVAEKAKNISTDGDIEL